MEEVWYIIIYTFISQTFTFLYHDYNIRKNSQVWRYFLLASSKQSHTALPSSFLYSFALGREKALTLNQANNINQTSLWLGTAFLFQVFQLTATRTIGIIRATSGFGTAKLTEVITLPVWVFRVLRRVVASTSSCHAPDPVVTSLVVSWHPASGLIRTHDAFRIGDSIDGHLLLFATHGTGVFLSIHHSICMDLAFLQVWIVFNSVGKSGMNKRDARRR